VTLFDAVVVRWWFRPGIRSWTAGVLAVSGVVFAILGHTSSSPTTSTLAAGSGSETRSWIAFHQDPGLWVVSPDGGQRRLLARRASGRAWSPDGRRIAFARRDKGIGIYVVNVGTGRERRLTHETTQVSVMAWSPDGRMIAFHRGYRPEGYEPQRAGPGDIYVVRIDGSGLRRLTRHGQAHYRPSAWSPDSRTFAITASQHGNAEVYVIDVKGGDERRMTHRPGWDSVYGWSPDGRNLLVGGVGRGPNDTFGHRPEDLYVISADGGPERNLTRSPESESGGAAWSPDGRRIAFLRNYGHGVVQVMNADGSNVRDLRAITVPDQAPSWSPDGRQLAFTGNLSRFEVHVINADGTKRRNLTPKGGQFPVWSPALR
jgi:TolB protein